MGIQIYTNQRAGPIWGPERGYNKGNVGYLKKIFLSQTTGTNALIFSMKHPWDKEIKFCANKVPGVIMAPDSKGTWFYIDSKLRKSSSHEPLAKMNFLN